MMNAPSRSARIAGLVLGACTILNPAGASAGDAPLPLMSPPDERAAPAPPSEALPDPGSAASGSRLLRALEERSSQTPQQGGPSDPSGLPLSAAEGCPRDLLSRLLADAVSESGALSALAIERETLKLCLERQRIVAGLFKLEGQLRELRAPPAPPVPSAPAAAAPPADRTDARHETPPIGEPAAPAVPREPAAVSPLRAALEGAATDTAPQTDPGPRYGWFSIIGAAGALRAGVTDGRRVWFVHPGDPLPDGVRIAAIAARPPGVLVADPRGTGDRSTLLPYRARPGDAP